MRLVRPTKLTPFDRRCGLGQEFSLFFSIATREASTSIIVRSTRLYFYNSREYVSTFPLVGKKERSTSIIERVEAFTKIERGKKEGST